MQKILVSIIIPIYKVEPYIVRCIESVLRQTYRNLEVILIDDCSPDRSMELAKKCIDLSPLSKNITFIYLHHDHKSAVLLLLEEGDEEVGRDICMHIAAMKPQGLRAEDLDQAVIENEKRIQLELMNADPKNANKPDAIKEKIINGSMHKFLAQKCLLSQQFVKDPSLTVEQFANKNGLKIIKFVHWMLGK